jgi:hypothetical protein
MKIKQKFINWFISKHIGNYYTEKEVQELLSGMSYEMAQEIIGNRPDRKKSTNPITYWMEHSKYNTNLFLKVK